MLPYNKRTEFDYQRFVENVLAFANTLPPSRTGEEAMTRVSREVDISREVLRLAVRYNQSMSMGTVLKLAGWAGLYLDEYRIEDGEHTDSSTYRVETQQD